MTDQGDRPRNSKRNFRQILSSAVGPLFAVLHILIIIAVITIQCMKIDYDRKNLDDPPLGGLAIMIMKIPELFWVFAAFGCKMEPYYWGNMGHSRNATGTDVASQNATGTDVASQNATDTGLPSQNATGTGAASQNAANVQARSKKEKTWALQACHLLCRLTGLTSDILDLVQFHLRRSFVGYEVLAEHRQAVDAALCLSVILSIASSIFSLYTSLHMLWKWWENRAGGGQEVREEHELHEMGVLREQ